MEYKNLILTDAAPIDDYQECVALGEWCIPFACRDKASRQRVEIIPYHWNDREKLKADFDRLQRLNDILLAEVSAKLERIHGIKLNNNSWRLLLGYWLNVYTCVLYDRWASLQQAIQAGSRFKTLVFECAPEELAAVDTSEFIDNASKSSYWNHCVYSLLILQTDISAKIRCEADRGYRGIPRYAASPRSGLKEIGREIAKYAARLTKRNDEIFFHGTRFSRRREFVLQAGLWQAPIPTYVPKFNPDWKFDLSMRDWTVSGQNCDDFEGIARKFLPTFLPKAFLEGFADSMCLAEKLPWPKSPKVIFTSVSHFGDDLFKAWAARKINDGARLVIGEHGGFGVGLFNGCHRYQLSVADRYVSGGWSDVPNVTPQGNSWLPYRKVSPKTDGRALLVCGIMSRYCSDARSMMLSSQVLSYFEDQFKFYGLLPHLIRGDVLVRLAAADHGWEQKERWLARYPLVALDDGTMPIWNLAPSCRLFISTYGATTYTESFALNFPTVMYWNPEHWELNPAAKPYFERLKAVGVFHESPESAARHIANIWADVRGWWFSDDVQNARSVFCEAYSATPPDLFRRLKSILLEEAGLASVPSPASVE